MRRSFVKILLLFVCSSLVSALPIGAEETPDAGRIAALVRKLGDESFVVRNKASEELRELGEPAVKLLKAYREDEDPEVRVRVKALLKLFAVVGTELQWLDPDNEGTPACWSGHGGGGVKLTFKNFSNQSVRIHWLGWDGTRTPWRGLLKPGTTAVCERSYQGHYWLVCDEDDVGLGIYKVDRRDPVIVVRDQR